MSLIQRKTKADVQVLRGDGIDVFPREIDIAKTLGLRFGSLAKSGFDRFLARLDSLKIRR